MIILALANEKGGVGKSMVVTQFAYYCAEKLGLKTLVIDLDHQANSTKALISSELCTIAPVKVSEILLKGKSIDINKPFVLVPADNDLTKLERDENKHNIFASHLALALESVENYYDICIIDTNPNPDIRQVTAMVCATHVLSPIQLNQEAIDGIGRLYTNIQKLKKINPNLTFFGLLPNLVEATPFQRQNYDELTEHYGVLMFKLHSRKVAYIRNRTAFAEAQAAGLPVWKIKKNQRESCMV